MDARADADATPPPDTRTPSGRRLVPFALWSAIYLGGASLLRLALLLRFGRGEHAGARDVANAFLVGLRTDLAAFAWIVVPLAVVALLLPARAWSSGTVRRLAAILFPLASAAYAFSLALEWYFFEEFDSRLNAVAIDYLVYPQEIFVNVWDSYPVLRVAAASALAGVLAWLACRRTIERAWEREEPLRARLLQAVVALAILATASATVSMKSTRFSASRVVDEIATNGEYAFAYAARTRDIEHAAFYLTLPETDAWQRARALVSVPGTTLDAKPDTITRQIAGDPSRPRLNVVIILEESLGSDFWGALGRIGVSCTPEMDALASSEGLLFTHVYACGNRTVRGMEGVLASFPPLAGESIVKRDRSDDVESVARVLSRDGYRTLFLYGGRGVFDGMRSFVTRNGWERFVEQKDFVSPTLTTVWGVCDEDLFHRGIEEMRALHQTGQPFLATLLTVSNHKPYFYPDGRIVAPPELVHRRERAVMYADWALADFFRRAKAEPFWNDTVFVVVADHGARVYGSETIPIRSYEIPIVVMGPAAVAAAARVDALGSSLDVAPTVLGIIGRPYRSTFFGRDLLHDPPEGGRAPMNHNRDVGLLEGDTMAVLGLGRTSQFYRLDRKRHDIVPLDAPGPAEQDRLLDTAALFQVADLLYMSRRYRVDASPPPAGR